MSVKSLSWMGNISYAQPQGRGEYPGAMCKKFPTVKAFNDYFKPGNEGESHMVIDMTYYRPWQRLFLTVGVIAMVTNQLTGDELNDMMEVQREVEFAMAKRRKERQEAKEKLKAEQAVVLQNKERLALVGEKYEARVKHMKAMDPTSQDRKDIEKLINSGDPEILFTDKKEAFQTGYLQGLADERTRK